jgi:plasmid maintenance system antidote protein VapI
MNLPPDPEHEPDYDPNRLLDALLEKMRLKNDAALSRALAVEAPTISKIRHKRIRVGAAMLLRMHEVSTLSIEELRTLMGDRRTRVRMPGDHGRPR